MLPLKTENSAQFAENVLRSVCCSLSNSYHCNLQSSFFSTSSMIKKKKNTFTLQLFNNEPQIYLPKQHQNGKSEMTMENPGPSLFSHGIPMAKLTARKGRTRPGRKAISKARWQACNFPIQICFQSPPPKPPNHNNNNKLKSKTFLYRK